MNLKEKYKINEKMADSGMSSVFSAYDKIKKRTVVIKQLSEEYYNDNDAIRRFKKEFILLKKIDSPYVVRVYEYFEEEIAYSMEYISYQGKGGYNLQELIKDKTKKNEVFETWEYIKYFKDICNGLSELHNNKIVHRDVKPSNFVLNEDGNLVVIDLGISKDFNDKFTFYGTRMGTINFKSPEQEKDSSTVKETSDIYSLGLVFLKIINSKGIKLRDKNYFASERAHSELLDIVNSEMKKFSVHKEIRNIIINCLQYQENERFQSVKEIKKLLDAINLENKNDSNFIRDKINNNKKELDPTLIIIDYKNDKIIREPLNIDLKGELFVGNDENDDIIIKNKFNISLVFYRSKKSYYIADRGCYYPVFINNKEIPKEEYIKIEFGDFISIGRKKIIFDDIPMT